MISRTLVCWVKKILKKSKKQVKSTFFNITQYIVYNLLTDTKKSLDLSILLIMIVNNLIKPELK